MSEKVPIDDEQLLQAARAIDPLGEQPPELAATAALNQFYIAKKAHNREAWNRNVEAAGSRAAALLLATGIDVRELGFVIDSSMSQVDGLRDLPINTYHVVFMVQEPLNKPRGEQVRLAVKLFDDPGANDHIFLDCGSSQVWVTTSEDPSDENDRRIVIRNFTPEGYHVFEAHEKNDKVNIEETLHLAIETWAKDPSAEARMVFNKAD